MSMLPAPLEDAILQSAAKARLHVVGRGEDRRYSVVGEKQFKNPLLFPPPKTRGLDKPRKVVFNASSTDTGEAVERSIEVLGNNVTSGYTSDTLDMIAVINEMWKEQGSSAEGVVMASYAEVARRLGKDENNGARHRKAVARELERLRRCVLIFSQYHIKDQIKNNHEITYFSDYRYMIDKANPSNNYFRAEIDRHVLENIRTGNIASLPIDALVALKFDKSKPVLLRVDSVLAAYERCELSCDKVYELAAIEMTDWTRKPVNRRKALEDIRGDIDGKVLSSGWAVMASLLTDAKGDGIKLAFARGERIVAPKDPADPKRSRGLQVVNTDPLLVQDLVNEIGRIVGEQAANESLYSLFARSYPEELLRRALSEFRADKPAELASAGAFFSSVLRRIVQEHGHAWVK